MTSAFEGLARIGGVPSIDGIPGGFGGLSESDRAWALAGLNELQTRIVLTKYQDKSELEKLKSAAYVEACRIVKENGWHVPVGKEHHRRLSNDAVLKFVYPKKCPRCKGRKYISVGRGNRGGPQRPCPTCGGTGKLQPRGDVNFVSGWRKRKVYQYRWQVFSAMLEAAESEAATSMWLKLRW